MLCPPVDLDEGALRRFLDEQYGADGAALRFVPLGEDSWSFECGALWVSLRRDLRGHVPAAYEAAHALRMSGLNFVLAPLRGTDGLVVHNVAGYPVVVFPYVDATQAADLPLSEREAAEVVALLSNVHACEIETELPEEDFDLPFAEDIEHALAATRRPISDHGPLSQRVHALLVHHQTTIAGLLTEFRDLARACRAAQGSKVLTHGEPIPTNILRYNGALLIGDWGDAMWAPPERDWAHLVRTTCARPPCRAAFLRFYEVRWTLSEIAEYTSVLLDHHDGGADHMAMVGRLLRYLPEEA